MNDEDTEISALDLLSVVYANLKLVIFVPVLVGLLAWGAARFAPGNYKSYAILSLPPASEFERTPMERPLQAATMLTSASVLDPVILKLNLLEGRSLQLARKDLADDVKVNVGKDGLLMLDVTAHSPTKAQAIANGIIDTWLKSTAPGVQESAELAKRLSYAQISLDAVTRLINHLDSENAVNLSKPLSRGEAGTSASFLGLGQLQIRYLAEVLSISRQMQGLSREVVKQAPTLPTDPESSKKGLIAALATVFTEFVLLAWIFARYSWKVSVSRPRIEKSAT
jgi:hypothetical protein